MTMTPIPLDVSRAASIYALDPPLAPGLDIQQSPMIVYQSVEAWVKAQDFSSEGCAGPDLPPIIQFAGDFCRDPLQLQNSAAILMYQKQLVHLR